MALNISSSQKVRFGPRAAPSEPGKIPADVRMKEDDIEKISIIILMTINFFSLIVIDCDTSLFYWPTVIVFEYPPTSVFRTVFSQPSKKSHI